MFSRNLRHKNFCNVKEIGLLALVLVCLSIIIGCSNFQQVSMQKDTNTIRLASTPLYSPVLKSRAITAENKTGAKGQGGKALGGRKGSPCLENLAKDQVYTFAEIDGPGCIRHIWMTMCKRDPMSPMPMTLLVCQIGDSRPSAAF